MPVHITRANRKVAGPCHAMYSHDSRVFGRLLVVPVLVGRLRGLQFACRWGNRLTGRWVGWQGGAVGRLVDGYVGRLVDTWAGKRMDRHLRELAAEGVEFYEVLR